MDKRDTPKDRSVSMNVECRTKLEVLRKDGNSQ